MRGLGEGGGGLVIDPTIEADPDSVSCGNMVKCVLGDK